MADGFAALFHEPLGRGGGTADTYAACIAEPVEADVGRSLDEMGTGIDADGLAVEHTSVAALFAADKKDDVVAVGKLAYVGDAVGNLPADGVEIAELVGVQDVLMDELDDFAETVERLGRLTVKGDGTVEVELVLHVIEIFDHDGMAADLSHQSYDFGVSLFAEYHNLCVGVAGKFVLDALLKMENDGTGGIDDVDIVPTGCIVGLRRFAVCPQQEFGIVEVIEVGMFDGLQTESTQTLAFTPVMHNITKAEERLALRQFLFCLANRRSDAWTEP